MKLHPIVRACRPQHYTKNLLVFSAPLFAFSKEIDDWLKVGIALIAFCLVSSSIYLLNDCLDREADRQHPSKRLRPIAAGLVSVRQALSLSAVMALTSIFVAWSVSILLGVVIILYILIQLGYCIRLKQEPLLDLFCISSGFLLRCIAGGMAADVYLSPWFLLTVGLLALFLAVEKRKAELHVLQGQKTFATRKVLERYSLPLLLRLEALVSTSAFMSYSLWSAGPTLNGARTSWMLLTVPFVLVGIFRYQLLSDPEESERRRVLFPDRSSEKPEKILLGDRVIKITLMCWILSTVLIGLISGEG